MLKVQGVIFADLAELGDDFTGKYIMGRIASQVTVLKIYESLGISLVVRRSPEPRSFAQPSLLGARSRRLHPISLNLRHGRNTDRVVSDNRRAIEHR